MIDWREMGESGKVMPNLDQKSTKLLNLTVLQRIDPCVEEILITAAHVTLYQFDIQLSQWSRKDVEGSLFVVKRSKQPRFQFIVMNRRNTENLVENLLGDFEYEIQVPYLLYRNAAQQVNGIWFYNARDCDEVASLFGRILNAYSNIPTTSISSSKSEFEELEAVPTMAVLDGPLEPPQSTTTNVTEAPDDPAFVNFFSPAMNMGNSSMPTLTRIQNPCATASLLSRPVNMPPMVPSPQIVSTANLTSASLLSLLDTSESNNNSNHVKKLVKPSSFSSLTPATYPLMVEPGSSSVPTAPSLNTQCLYGAQFLQPFPPSSPPSSLTPASAPTHNYGSAVSRDKVQDAVLLLAQDNQFIDMVYRTLLNAHHS